MNRSDAAREVKSRYADYLQPAKKRIAGKPTYICPLCGNGTGKDGDGMSIDPKGDGTRLKCFKCGFYGDIVDLYQQQHACDAGEAFTALYDLFGITIENEATRTATEPRNESKATNTPPKAEKAAEGQITATEGKPDYTAYYKACKERIKDPAALEYLSFRGISEETAAAYWIGYDPAADPASAPGAMGDEYKPHPCPRLIIPFDRSHYMGRSILEETPKAYKKLNNKQTDESDTAPPFNMAALYNEAARPVFITEGAIDALSIIEAGGIALATNSASNRQRIIEALKEKKTNSTLILCYDNDDAGGNGNKQLAEGLKELETPFLQANICGEQKDPNEALTADRVAFTEAVKAAEGKARFPGLLTLERAKAILEAVDDNFLEMPLFPQLSETAKLKTHDTVVIAADTGAGKSSLALNFLHELQSNYPALYINLEMDEATILQRLVAIHTGIELDQIEGYNHDQRTRDKVDAAIKELAARREIQLLTDTYDLKEIETQIKAATRGRTEPTIVFIDTGLLVNVGNKSASRYERFTQISEELRRISRLNNIIMFVLLQQNRESKKNEKAEPKNSSLKESGSWENDATKIMFLWYNPKTQCKELAITKNRNGKTGSIQLNYYPHTQTYSEVKGGFISYDGKSPFDDDDNDEIPTI